MGERDWVDQWSAQSGTTVASAGIGGGLGGSTSGTVGFMNQLIGGSQFSNILGTAMNQPSPFKDQFMLQQDQQIMGQDYYKVMLGRPDLQYGTKEYRGVTAIRNRIDIHTGYMVRTKWKGLNLRSEYSLDKDVVQYWITDRFLRTCRILELTPQAMREIPHMPDEVWWQIDHFLEQQREEGVLIATNDYGYNASSIWYSDENKTWTGTWDADRSLTLNNGDTFELTWQYDPEKLTYKALKEESHMQVKLTLTEAKYLEELTAKEPMLKDIMAKIEEGADFQIVVSFRSDDD